MIYKEKAFILKDGSKVIIKSPDVKEAKDILAFMVEVTGQSDFLLSSSEDFMNKTIEDEEKWIKGKNEGDACILTVYKDGKIIANSDIEFMKHKKTLHRSTVGVSVDKEYWNKGIGSIIFEEFIKIAKEHPNTEQIELGVISINERAIHLYKKFGFKETGIIPASLKLKDGTYLDEILMTKFLNE